MLFTDVHDAVEEAKKTIRMGDEVARRVALLLVGRLRLIDLSCTTLEALKRELKDYNIQTRSWRDEP